MQAPAAGGSSLAGFRAGAEYGLGAAGDQIAERLVAAATGGRDGALHLIGDPGGLVHLAGGRVLLAQTPAVPSVDALIVHRMCTWDARADLVSALRSHEGREAVTARARHLLVSGMLAPLALDVLHQQAVADAVWALLATDATVVTRTRFYRGERPWTSLTGPLRTEEVFAEAARRRRRLTRSGTPPTADVRPARVESLPRAARLTPLQWELAAAADGRRTARDLAFLLGRGVFATLLETTRMAALGLLTLAPPEPTPDRLEVRRP